MSYLLIWDIDGTLIQGRGMGKKAMEAAFKDLYGIEDGLRDVHLSGLLDSIIYKKALEAHDLVHLENKRFYDQYLNYLEKEVQLLDSNIDAPGILHLLEELDGDYRFYNILGTGNIERGAKIKLSVHDMYRFFATGGFDEGQSERWEVIMKAWENAIKLFQEDFTCENTYVIGDTPMDIACGKKLNFKTIAIATGMFSYESLQSYQPDFLFHDLSDTDSFLSIFQGI